MKKLIKVTKTGILNGVRGNSKCCPIARACVAAGLQDVRVGSRSVGFKHHKEGEWLNRWVVLPKKAQKFIEKFDDQKKVHPFTFKLDLEKQI